MSQVGVITVHFLLCFKYATGRCGFHFDFTFTSRSSPCYYDSPCHWYRPIIHDLHLYSQIMPACRLCSVYLCSSMHDLFWVYMYMHTGSIDLLVCINGQCRLIILLPCSWQYALIILCISCRLDVDEEVRSVLFFVE